jgi:hypothetical protein
MAPPVGRVEDVMLEAVKVVGLSATLSAGLVTASAIPGMPVAGSVASKIYFDRAADTARPRLVAYAAPSARGTATQSRGDSLRAAPDRCAAQAWPNIPHECLTAIGTAPVRNSVRTITIEQREGASTSVLVRLPAALVAQR